MNNEFIRTVMKMADELPQTYLFSAQGNGLEQWIPIADLLGKGWSVGLSRNGDWVREVGGQIGALDFTYLLRGLLPCLESPWERIVSDLRSGLAANRLPIDLAETFPYEGIIRIAFSFQSDYWTGLALDWLAQMPVSQGVARQLSDVSNARWASQRSKQKAKRLLKRLDTLGAK